MWTGLMDKGGNRIYEGDIVKLPRWGVHTNIIGIVRYESATFCHFYIDNDIYPITLGFQNEIYVIGNVWENKELLPELLEDLKKA